MTRLARYSGPFVLELVRLYDLEFGLFFLPQIVIFFESPLL